MTALKWLLPLFLLVSQLAHAQQAPAPEGLVPDVSLPADPGNDAPAQQTSPAPPHARPADAANLSDAASAPIVPPLTPQATPAPAVPTTQTTFRPGPYIQPPAGSVRAITVPAYPGTAPYRFASSAELVDYGTWRVDRLRARERGLSLMGRPPNYLAKRIGGFVALGAGGLTAVACAGYFVLNSTPNTSENEARRDRAFGLLAAGGLGLVLGAGVWLHYIKRENPYRNEMVGLRREQKEWLVQIKRARKTAKIRARTSFNLTSLRFQF